MKTSGRLKTAYYEIAQSEKGGCTISLNGRMDAFTAAPLIREFTELLKQRSPSQLTVDLQGVHYLDDFGVLALVELRNMVPGGSYALRNPRPEVQDILSIHDFEALARPLPVARKRLPGVLVRLGDATIRQYRDLRYMVSFIGSICLSVIQVCLDPRKLRGDDTFECMQKTGVDALPIVGLISFLLGLIIAFMSSVQLRQFGANIYVASLVGLAMTRELGPIMTAIIVAGRSGSAYAAEIGTMKISEEIDALFTMGFDPTRFLVVPKMLATVAVVPLLTLFSDIFAIMGGLIVGITMLDLTAGAYMAQTIKTLTLFDVSLGFLKSGVFAVLITWISCLRGFQVWGGAASVGQATTSAVVSSIFLIILANSIFAVILQYWG